MHSVPHGNREIAMIFSASKATSPQVSIARITPYRLTGGVFEVRWRDGKRRRSVLLAPRNPLQPTAAEVLEAVRSAYPSDHAPDIVIPERAWQGQ